MKPLVSFALVGALALGSLTACSSDGGDISDFCAVSDSFGAESDFALGDLSDTAMEAALAGDMTEVNAWGESSADAIDEMVAQVAKARGGAPTDEVVKALDDVDDVLELMGGFADLAASATDLAGLMTAIEELGTEFEAVEDAMNEAGEVLDAAAAEYCS